MPKKTQFYIYLVNGKQIPISAGKATVLKNGDLLFTTGNTFEARFQIGHWSGYGRVGY